MSGPLVGAVQGTTHCTGVASPAATAMEAEAVEAEDLPACLSTLLAGRRAMVTAAINKSLP